jgi:hypothetical protein
MARAGPAESGLVEIDRLSRRNDGVALGLALAVLAFFNRRSVRGSMMKTVKGARIRGSRFVFLASVVRALAAEEAHRFRQLI